MTTTISTTRNTCGLQIDTPVIRYRTTSLINSAHGHTVYCYLIENTYGAYLLYRHVRKLSVGGFIVFAASAADRGAWCHFKRSSVFTAWSYAAYFATWYALETSAEFQVNVCTPQPNTFTNNGHRAAARWYRKARNLARQQNRTLALFTASNTSNKAYDYFLADDWYRTAQWPPPGPIYRRR